jgi:hypothetical protein
MSGLKVNFHKSSLVGINLDEDYTAGITNVTYCKWDTLPSDIFGCKSEENFNLEAGC